MSIVSQEDIKYLIHIHPVFKTIFENYGAPPGWSRPQGFVSLSKIILEQQVSLASANAHYLKLNGYIGEFTPTNILGLNDDEMRICQISRQKATYLRALSNAVLNGEIDLNILPVLSEIEIREQLTKINGIGSWTTEIYMMFCLQKKDIFPVGDIAVVNTMKELFNVRTKEEILMLAENWKPYRSLAVYFLWHHYLKKRNRSSV